MAAASAKLYGGGDGAEINRAPTRGVAMPKEGKDHSFSGSDKCQICGMSRKAYDDMGQPCRGPYPAPPISPDKPPAPRRDKTRAPKLLEAMANCGPVRA